MFFFFKQKTAYDMRISDWSSDVCSSDLDCTDGVAAVLEPGDDPAPVGGVRPGAVHEDDRRLRLARPFRRRAVSLRSDDLGRGEEIGRASCRERVCQYV